MILCQGVDQETTHEHNIPVSVGPASMQALRLDSLLFSWQLECLAQLRGAVDGSVKSQRGFAHDPKQRAWSQCGFAHDPKLQSCSYRKGLCIWIPTGEA